MGVFETPGRRGELGAVSISRRSMLTGAAVTPVAAAASPAVVALPNAAPVDPTIAICQRWLEIEVERGHLQTAWGHHESWLARERNRFGLSKAEREALPEAGKLRELDERMEALSDEGWALLDQLPSTPATSVAAVIANLTIAGTILGPEDYPTVHQLVVRAVDDLAALT